MRRSRLCRAVVTILHPRPVDKRPDSPDSSWSWAVWVATSCATSNARLLTVAPGLRRAGVLFDAVSGLDGHEQGAVVDPLERAGPRADLGQSGELHHANRRQGCEEGHGCSRVRPSGGYNTLTT